MKTLNDYQTILVFDIETTGFDYKNDEIIEFGGLLITLVNGAWKIQKTLQFFVHTSRKVSLEILNLTNITLDQIEQGITQKELFTTLKTLPKDILWIAYNAQFDISFIDSLFKRFDASTLFKPDILDLMAIYKDRYDYPHKLNNALETFNITIEGHHRAIFDAEASYELLLKLNQESSIFPYINVIGYHPKYGLSGVRYPHIRYYPQEYKRNDLLTKINKDSKR